MGYGVIMVDALKYIKETCEPYIETFTQNHEEDICILCDEALANYRGEAK